MRRSGCLLVGLMVLGTAALASPKLTATPELYDFGVVMDGVVVQYQVTLTNSGTSTLSINNVGFNCSCTSYSLPKRILAPGESVQMTVTFRTLNYSRYPQPVSQTLTIYSNDPTRPGLPVVVRGQVRVLAAHEGTPSTLYNDYYVLVDLRPAVAYARGHLLGAMSIPFAQLEARMNELPRSNIVYLYDETGVQAVQAAEMLHQNGFLIPRALTGGLVRWWQLYGDLLFVWAPDAARTPPEGAPYYGTLRVTSPDRVIQNYLYIVDIRAPEAFAQGHFPGAVNVQLPTQTEVAAWAAAIPRPRSGAVLSIWIVDEDGSRAGSIAQYLQSLGLTSARALLGGITAWRAAHGDTLLFPSL